ncbi:MAG TPA: ABC transporter ATP-binding protein [Clostridiaceae bacterium]|nr:ABC transporter ATP-binding protein [Clostridiaceae bacterium]
MTENKVLEIRELDFYIEDYHILKNINLSVSKGEFVGLIGPNGAGKTTLLKCINGINKGKGQIIINNLKLEKLSAKKIAREVALMHQDTSVNFPFPAIDVVLSGRYPYLRFAEVESAEDYRIARKYMSYTNTLQFERKPITTVSGGERQRIFFAKILTQETDIILLDEPTSNLDIAHEEQIFRYCRDLCNKGKTVIAAVHDLKIASRYCSRLILLKDGEIIADGSVEEVLTKENISMAYGVKAIVYKNNFTGLLDFYIPDFEDAIQDTKKDNKAEKSRIHIIGGCGAGADIIRRLFEKGYKLSAGVLSKGDSDLNCAQAYGVKCVVEKPFSDIGDEKLSENVEYIKGADITILCNIPFGTYNLKNLEAARYASKLVIIEDKPPEERDFTGGKAIEIYKKLRESAIITTCNKVYEEIKNYMER